MSKVENDETKTEEDDDDDDEPKLKYERVGNAVQKIFKQDAASCMSVHQKFIALGTHYGVVYVLDHQGNDVRNKEFPSHTTTVNMISIDSSGDYIASCSEDGRVVINGLYSTENNLHQMFDCPIRAIALHPDFGKKGNHQFIVGAGEKLVLYEKGWIRNKSIMLFTGEGFIRTIKWRTNFVAFSSVKGVDIIDVRSRARIGHIVRDQIGLRDDLYRCNLCWKDDQTLLVAWGTSIKVCVIKEKPMRTTRDARSHEAELAHEFVTDFYACGIAPFGNELVALCYFLEPADEQTGGGSQKGRAQRPQLLVLKPDSYNKYEETSTDALSVRGFEVYQCHHYHLEPAGEENLFYILSPKDIVVAKPRDLDDHISWLMEREMFKEALDEAKQHQKDLKVHNFLAIGKTYLNFLIKNRKFEEAAALCDRVLGKNKEVWEEQVNAFLTEKKVKIITPYIPYNDPLLSSHIYEMVLYEYLETDCEGFKKLIQEWPPTIYNTERIIYELQSKLKEEPDNLILLQTLGMLYAHEKQYDKGLSIYLKLGHAGVFEMIYKHNLVKFVKDKAVALMKIDATQAIKLYVDDLDESKPGMIVDQLKKHPKLLHLEAVALCMKVLHKLEPQKYLHGLFVRDAQAGQDYHEYQVELYADFDRNRLLPFLRSSNYYPLEKAFKICEERDFIPEMVFLLARMGNAKKALSLIIHKQKDIAKAIDFAKEQNDSELWQDLIDHSTDDPHFIKELLLNVGTHINPITLMQRIRPGLEIPGLRDALVKILRDYNLQVSLNEGCKSIVDKDSLSLLRRQLKAQSRGYSIPEIATCKLCEGNLIVEDSRQVSSMVVFFCGHHYHEDCLMKESATAEFRCPPCSAKSKKRGQRVSSNLRR